MKNGKWVLISLMSLFLFTMLSPDGLAQGKSNRHRDRHRHHGGDYYGHRGSQMHGDLSSKIYRVTHADSLQAKKMKPLLDKASNRIEILRANYHLQEKRVLDSLRFQLKPILKEDQLKRLEDFKSKDKRKGK